MKLSAESWFASH